ncbi:hypothetical protein D9M72_591810 [compost metagenome]
MQQFNQNFRFPGRDAGQQRPLALQRNPLYLVVLFAPGLRQRGVAHPPVLGIAGKRNQTLFVHAFKAAADRALVHANKLAHHIDRHFFL